MTDHPLNADSLDARTPSQIVLSLERVVLPLLLLASIVVNGFFIVRLRRLQTVVDTVKSEQSLIPGALVPPIQGRTLEGNNAELHFDSVHVPTLLYVFTPQCGWCYRNLANLQALSKQQGSTYRLVGLSLTRDGLTDYLARHTITLPTYTDLSAQTVAKYRLGATPTTILVQPSGVVSYVWRGAYDVGVKHDIEKTLHVVLPVAVKP